MPGQDPAIQSLVKAPDGTMYLTTSSQDPGGQTYVAIMRPDGGIKFGAPLPGNALSGVVVGPGGKLYQATDQGTYVLDTSSWTVRHAPEDDGNGYSVDPIGADGVVTGSILATDLDNDTLTYEFEGGDSGVEVQQDGCGRSPRPTNSARRVLRNWAGRGDVHGDRHRRQVSDTDNCRRPQSIQMRAQQSSCRPVRRRPVR